MARARLLKPGFFTNEELADLSPLHRLCYEGLWTQADRLGRLEDRPKRIKIAILPFDDVDVDALLTDLAAHGFIIRYEVNGDRYIAIPTFPKHQTPHIKEPDSAIPAPPKGNKLHSTGPVSGQHGTSTGLTPGQTALVQSPCTESLTGSLVQDRCTESEAEPESESESPSAPLRGASPPKGGEPPLRGSRKTQRNAAAMHRAVAHIQSRGKR